MFARILQDQIDWGSINEDFALAEYKEYIATVRAEIESFSGGSILQFVDDTVFGIEQSFEFCQHLYLTLNYKQLHDCAVESTDELQQQLVEKCLPELLGLDTEAITEQESYFRAHLLKKFELPDIQLQKQLKTLQNQFGNNILNDIDNRKLVVNAKDYTLDGIDQNIQSKLVQDDKIILSSASHVSLQVMTYCKDEKLRKLYYEFEQGRCLENEGVLIEEIKTKRQIANNLNYPSVADWKLANRMVGTRGELEDFYTRVYALLKEQFGKDVRMISPDGDPEPWNLSFLMEAYRQEHYCDMRDFDKYFPKATFIERFLGFLSKELGIEFQHSPVQAWHPDVVSYHILNENQRIGELHFDLYQRENKMPGGWIQVISPRIFSVQCNFTPDRENFAYDEISTLAHETGHGLHAIFARPQFRCQHALDVAWDFVEVPSQFCEGFCENYQYLKEFAIDKSGNQLPESGFRRLIACANFCHSVFTMRQIGLGVMDLKLHCDWDYEDLDEYIFSNTKQYEPTRRSRKSIVRHFSHIFGNTYDYTVGYYSYLWSDYIRVNLFLRYMETGDLAEYVRKILVPGASVNPTALVKDYVAELSIERFINYYK